MHEVFTTENFAVLFSIAFVILNARGKIMSWPLAIIGSALYVLVFFLAKLYADMALQIFYVILGIYGWYSWSSSNSEDSFVPQKAETKMIFFLIALGFLLSAITGYLLENYTDADLPYWDALTTVFSLIATWMMAQKFIANWVFWIFIDLLCILIYIYKGLNTTVFLFGIYTLMAVYGYFSWSKILKIRNAEL